MNQRLTSRRAWFWLVWVMVFALAGHFVPHARAALRSAAAIGSNPLTTQALVPPRNLKANLVGQEVVLTWSAGANGDGYIILGSASKTPACATVTWKAIGRVAGIAVTTYVDPNRAVSKGTWYCYMVETARMDWTSRLNPTMAVQKRRTVQVVAPSPTQNPDGLVQTAQTVSPTARPTISKTPANRGTPTRSAATATWTRTSTATPKTVATATLTFTLTPTPTLVRTAVPTPPASADGATLVRCLWQCRIDPPSTAGAHVTASPTPTGTPTIRQTATPTMVVSMTPTLAPTNVTSLATPIAAGTLSP